MVSRSSSWRFRPSGLDSKYPSKGVGELVEEYHRDNKRATTEGVTILPPISSPTTIRTLQWNVHGFMTAEWETSPQIMNEFFRAIFQTDADVLILNEYNKYNRTGQLPSFEEHLRQNGYTTFMCGSVEAPTAIATRWKVVDKREVYLGHQRSAVLLLVERPDNQYDNTRIWIVGTHLDDQDGGIRNYQMQTLLGNIRFGTTGIILAGDFNQQRQEDYTKSEWKLISQSMARRKVSEDDGVSTMLHNEEFICAWDADKSRQNKDATNWDTSRPPSTHWSGTIVDYSYGKFVQSLRVSISPIDISDHRMTVCDLNIHPS